MSKKELTLLILCLAFVLTQFLKFIPPGNVVSLGLPSVYALFYNSFRNKLLLLRSRPWLLLILGFAGYLIASALFSDDTHSAWRVIQLRLPLMVFPITFGLISISVQLRNRILIGSAIIVTGCTLISFLYALYQFHATNLNFWLYNDSVSYLTGQQSIYLSLLVNLSIFIFAWAIVYLPTRALYKNLMGGAILLLFLLNYMLASRNMMLLLYASVPCFCFFYLFKRKKYLEGATLIMAMIIGGVLITKFFPGTINRFRELSYTRFNYQTKAPESHFDAVLDSTQWNGANFRLAAWPCGWQVFKEHPFLGVGIGDKRAALTNVYRQRGFQFAIDTNKNVHNNYLDILLGTGIAGFLLFFAGWVLLPLIKLLQLRDGLGLVIVFSFLTAMITENYFDRSLGSMIFSFFLLLLMISTDKKLPPEIRGKIP